MAIDWRDPVFAQATRIRVGPDCERRSERVLQAERVANDSDRNESPGALLEGKLGSVTWLGGG